MPSRDESYWTDARFGLEIIEPNAPSPRVVVLARPFGLIGRLADSDIRFDDRSVSGRHAYLHADARGVFVVDLATRTGTRFDGKPASCGWLRPDEAIEIGGRLIRVGSFEVGGKPSIPPTSAVNLLADSGDVPLCGLALEPVGQRGVSWALGSELVFVGRGDSCGIRLNQADVAATHSALFRTPATAFVIILPGHPTLVNGQSPRGAIALNDGDTLTFGQSRFIARITPLASHEPPPAQGRELDRVPPQELATLVNLPALREFGGLPDVDVRSFPLELIPPESREAVLGWMLGTLHAGQTEILRRQDDLQQSVALILQHIKTDSDVRHASHRDRLEALAVELARLEAKTQIPPPSAPSSTSPHQPISHLSEEPRRPARDIPPAPEIDPARSLETAAWLLARNDRASNENKFSFRSFLTRRGAAKVEPSLLDNSSNQLLASDAAKGDGDEGS